MRTLEEKLETKFANSDRHWGRRNAFVWTSQHGLDDVRYGSYKTVYEDELVNREYRLEEVDYDVGIFYTDVLHNPRTYLNERNHGIRLRRASTSDAETLYELIDRSRENLSNMTWAATATVESTYKFLSNLVYTEMFRLITLNEEVVGVITLRPRDKESYEIGYWLDNLSRGKGVMKEAVRQMTALSRYPVHARVRSGNTASIKVLEENGFKANDLGETLAMKWLYFVKQP